MGSGLRALRHHGAFTEVWGYQNALCFTDNCMATRAGEGTCLEAMVLVLSEWCVKPMHRETEAQLGSAPWARDFNSCTSPPPGKIKSQLFLDISQDLS